MFPFIQATSLIFAREITGIETEHLEFLHILEAPEPHSKANEAISELQAHLVKETVKNQPASATAVLRYKTDQESQEKLMFQAPEWLSPLNVQL